MTAHWISTPFGTPPHIAVEELDRDDVIVRIVSTPPNPRGATLAEEVLTDLRGTNGARTEAPADSDGHGRSDGNGGTEPAWDAPMRVLVTGEHPAGGRGNRSRAA